MAENSATPTTNAAKPTPVKSKSKAHAEHAKPVTHKLAAIHHRHVAAHAKLAARKPHAHPHRFFAAHEHAPADHNAPIVMVNARPAPVERAEAEQLAAAIDRPAPQPVAAPAASEFVTAFLSQAFRIARSMDQAPEQRRTDLANLMTTRMDLSRILVYATHAAYQAASPEMQAQFRQSFASFLAEAYTPRIKLAAELSFTTSPPRRNQDGGITVSTIFTKPGIAESTIDWQLEPSSDSYRIVDVGSEGVSLLAIQRSSFTSVMANDGGLPGLLSKMDARTRELASAAK
jgi:phospholipid transport system substrate-binding protein